MNRPTSDKGGSPEIEESAREVSLEEQLWCIPKLAVLRWTDEVGLQATHHVPIGRLAHASADRIAALLAENRELRAAYNPNERLREALRRLSFAAQTSGGTAGRDEELVAAIAQAETALSHTIPIDEAAELRRAMIEGAHE